MRNSCFEHMNNLMFCLFQILYTKWTSFPAVFMHQVLSKDILFWWGIVLIFSRKTFWSLSSLGLQLYQKRDPGTGVFDSVNFEEFLRTPFFKEHLWGLHLFIAISFFQGLQLTENASEQYEWGSVSTNKQTMREKCPYSELFWSLFSGIRTEFEDIWSTSPYSVRIRENTDQNNSEYRHFLYSENLTNFTPRDHPRTFSRIRNLSVLIKPVF